MNNMNILREHHDQCSFTQITGYQLQRTYDQ